MASIATIQQEAYFRAVESGWWPEHQDVNVPEKIALMHSELSEALEELRAGRDVAERYYTGDAGLRVDFPVSPDGRPYKPEGVPSELADVIIRILDLCGHFGIDMEAVLEEKMRYNATRSFRHGGRAF